MKKTLKKLLTISSVVSVILALGTVSLAQATTSLPSLDSIKKHQERAEKLLEEVKENEEVTCENLQQAFRDFNSRSVIDLYRGYFVHIL